MGWLLRRGPDGPDLLQPVSTRMEAGSPEDWPSPAPPYPAPGTYSRYGGSIPDSCPPPLLLMAVTLPLHLVAPPGSPASYTSSHARNRVAHGRTGLRPAIAYALVRWVLRSGGQPRAHTSMLRTGALPAVPDSAQLPAGRWAACHEPCTDAHRPGGLLQVCGHSTV